MLLVPIVPKVFLWLMHRDRQAKRKLPMLRRRRVLRARRFSILLKRLAFGALDQRGRIERCWSFWLGVAVFFCMHCSTVSRSTMRTEMESVFCAIDRPCLIGQLLVKASKNVVNRSGKCCEFHLSVKLVIFLGLASCTIICMHFRVPSSVGI